MGGIGIWCMHFIGNRAVVLDDGSAQRQIAYSPTFTAVSFFLPILVLLGAFYFLGITESVGVFFLLLAGFLTGTAVCGMHYVGQLGIANYSCHYRTQNVIGAAVIAIIASSIALSVFFRLRDSWTDGWWKRTLCGALLACAVSGMHSTAAVGTTYLPRPDFAGVVRHSRLQTVIVCSILSIVTCVVLLFIAVKRSRDIKLTKARAQQLVLACAYFDESGRVMVSPQGTFPSQIITNHFVEKTFGEDELCRSHPTFVWLYAATRNWSCLKDLIPGMVDRINSDPVAVKYFPGHRAPSTKEDEVEVSCFGAIFKQLFCVSAEQLADTIHEPLEKIGVLFEEPLETGVVDLSAQARVKNRVRRLSTSLEQADVETSKAPLFGKGKFLFLTRRLGRQDVAKFASQGYRFGSIRQLSDLLAKTLQVPEEITTSYLQRMQLCSAPESVLSRGVHLACFMVRPSVEQSFDVLVQKSQQNRLPLVQLGEEPLNESQLGLVSSFDNWTVKQMLTKLANDTQSCDRENLFRWKLYGCLTRLIDSIGDYEPMKVAKFSARQICIPCPDSIDQNTCILTVRVMNAVHTRAPRPNLGYVPLSFFSLQQEVDSVAHGKAFSHRVRKEFGDERGDASQRRGNRWNGSRSRVSEVFRSTVRHSPEGRDRDFSNSIGVDSVTLVSSTIPGFGSEGKTVESVETGLEKSDSEESRGWVSEIFALLMT